jgi:hypothetical protein
MQYSLKGAAKWIKPNLVLARQHAINYKGANPHLLKVGTYLASYPLSFIRAELTRQPRRW